MARTFPIVILLLVLIMVQDAFAAVSSCHFSTLRAPALGARQLDFLPTRLNLNEPLTRAWRLMSALRFGEARDVLKRLVSQKPDDPYLVSEACTYLGYCHMNLKDPVHAREALTKALLYDSRNELAHYFLANLCLLDGDKAGARKHLLQAIAIRSDFIVAYEMLARLLFESGDTKGYIKNFAAIVALLPHSAYYRSELAGAYIRNGDHQDAVRELLALIELEPASPLSYQRLGNEYISLKKLDKADECFDKVLSLEPSFPYGYMGKARILLLKGDLGNAKILALRAVSLQPDSQDVHRVLNMVNEAIAERTRATRNAVLVAAGIALLIAGLIISLLLNQRRKYVIQVISGFNRELEGITEKEKLAEFLTSFFTDLFQPSGLLLLTYNRQSAILSTLGARGIDLGGAASMQIFTGSDIAGWTVRRTRPFIELDDARQDKLFADSFPDLAERMELSGLERILVLKEKNVFVGLVLLGGEKTGGILRRYEHDLVNPLLSLTAGALNSFYLYETSVIDETTRLFNKRYFKQTLAMELRRADRYQQPCSLVTFDIDNFKKVNDIYGHGQGDRVLAELGGILLATIREGIDTAARTGGEEFYLILPATSTERALATAQRLRTLVEEHIFPGFPKVVKVTVSMGVATYPQHGATGDELITRADEAQYTSKRTGKNKVTVATTAAEDQGKKGEAFFIESRFDGLNVKDNMTGLFNASYFSMRLKDEIRRVSRYLIPCSLVLVRVAWPSEQTTRRELLKKTGMVLKESLREGIDTPAVLDENTLAVIVPETPPELAAPIAERLRAALETRAFGSLAPGLKMSACVVSCPFHGKEENELMRNAFLFLGKAQEEEGNWIVTGAAEPD